MNLESYVIEAMHKKSRYLGDDAAVVGSWLYSQDAFFENVHFKRAWLTPYEIGAKAMLVNVSDAIAMNAQPKFALLTLAFPKTYPKHDLNELMRGINETAFAHGCEVIGGDTIANCKLDLSITIIATSSKPLLRNSVKEANLLAFTGALGTSQKGLQALMRGGKARKSSRFIAPTLRAAFVKKARRFLSGGMDISDGLLEDSKKLTHTIRRSFRYDAKKVHRFGCSGEEYEMLVAFDRRHLKALKRIAVQTRTPLTVFGTIAKSQTVRRCKANHF